jgi:hypothetical protein
LNVGARNRRKLQIISNCEVSIDAGMLEYFFQFAISIKIFKVGSDEK